MVAGIICRPVLRNRPIGICVRGRAIIDMLELGHAEKVTLETVSHQQPWFDAARIGRVAVGYRRIILCGGDDRQRDTGER